MRNYCFLLALNYLCECVICPKPADRASDWTDVVTVRDGTSVTLRCPEDPLTTAWRVTWKARTDVEDSWTELFSINTNKGLAHGLLRKLHQLGSRTFMLFEDASMQFIATATDGGRYLCQMQGEGKKLKERTILLALIKLTLAPASIPMDSIMSLKAEISPSYTVAGGMWLSPTRAHLVTVMPAPGILLTKLPRVTRSDSGLYTCIVRFHGQSSEHVQNHTLPVTVNEWKAAVFPNITYEETLNLVAASHSSVNLSCPPISGDFVQLYWWRADKPNVNPQLIYKFDRWRNNRTHAKAHLQLLGPSRLTEAGNFSFVLRPALADAGRYQCEIFMDDQVFGQATTLTVVHVTADTGSSSLNLQCTYNKGSQISSVNWSHVQRPGVSLPMTGVIGQVTIAVPLPVTAETAGQYVCTVHLKNGQASKYIQTVSVSSTARPCCMSELPTEVTTDTASSLPPPGKGDSMSEPSILLHSLFLLLFLVPTATAAVGLLLWRRGSCASSRNVESTLSHYSGEVENIYENPEDLRQSAPQGAVYMDLKPTGETDVYRELDRYDPCCG